MNVGQNDDVKNNEQARSLLVIFCFPLYFFNIL